MGGGGEGVGWGGVGESIAGLAVTEHCCGQDAHRHSSAPITLCTLGKEYCDLNISHFSHQHLVTYMFFSESKESPASFLTTRLMQACFVSVMPHCLCERHRGVR